MASENIPNNQPVDESSEPFEIVPDGWKPKDSFRNRREPSPELDDDDDLFEDGDDEPLSLFDHPLKLGESTDQGRSSNQPKEVSVRERKGSKKISDESIESLTLKELKDKLIGLTGRQMWIRRTSGSWQKARLDEVYNNLFVKMVWDDWSSGEEMKKNLFILIIFIGISSCSKDDDNSSQSSQSIYGKWYYKETVIDNICNYKIK